MWNVASSGSPKSPRTDTNSGAFVAFAAAVAASASNSPSEESRSSGKKSKGSSSGLESAVVLGLSPKSLLSELLESQERSAKDINDAGVDAGVGVVVGMTSEDSNHVAINSIKLQEETLGQVSENDCAAAAVTTMVLGVCQMEPTVQVMAVVPTELADPQTSPSSSDFFPNDTPAVWHNFGVNVGGISPTKRYLYIYCILYI